ncbi:hypothetical protein [Kitasatospora kifunensis]|uniref:Uncharacterized protein n=1 Tax=Kitasatospora kifunensis TaxID=58351 RepID=A0A7W7RC04_KITKI|nr:hypothetical protein [Kitasatospora kifunensis]MBB4929124.1 hypothetical protein [Kitasatospora kifunensis]
MADPRKQQIKARMHARPGETYMQARRRLTDPSTWTVETAGFLFSCSLPNGQDPRSTFLAAPEMVLAAAVANSAQILTRQSTGEEYPAWSDVVVLRPQRPAQPDEAPPGWYPVEAFILVRARRPWSKLDEDEQVITDAYQAARDTVGRMWPGLPEEWAPAAMNLTTVAGLRGWTDADLKRLAQDPLGRSTTVGADPSLLPEGA